ncbi:MAG: prepilin-type N-terminal cleavage/methylation domain-containing protein [Clostridiaceae bacterium]
MYYVIKNQRHSNKAFTLVELIAVISIISILASIAIPRFAAYSEKAKKQVCKINCLQIERDYELYLTINGLEHSDILFDKFLDKYEKTICSDHGDITYVNGKVKCSIHSAEDKNEIEDDDSEEVPFL